MNYQTMINWPEVLGSPNSTTLRNRSYLNTISHTALIFLKILITPQAHSDTSAHQRDVEQLHYSGPLG